MCGSLRVKFSTDWRIIMRTSIPENWILTSIYCIVVFAYITCVMIGPLRNVLSEDIDLSSSESIIIFIVAFWKTIPGSILIFDTSRNKVYKAAIALWFGAMGDFLLYIEDYDAFSTLMGDILFYGGMLAFTIQNCIFLTYYYPYIYEQIWSVYVIFTIIYLIVFGILFAVFEMYNDTVFAICSLIYGIIVALDATWAILTQNKLSGIGYSFHCLSDIMLVCGLYIELDEIAFAIYHVVYMIFYWIGIYCIGAGVLQLNKQVKQQNSDLPQQPATQEELFGLKVNSDL